MNVWGKRPSGHIDFASNVSVILTHTINLAGSTFNTACTLQYYRTRILIEFENFFCSANWLILKKH